MTASEVARLLKGKRAGTGKWAAKCPSHRDRSPSLSIREGKKCVLIHCFRGCELETILATIGLRTSDLYPDEKPNREAMRLAEKLRSEEETKRKAERKRVRDRQYLYRKWEACRNALGLLLIQRPSDDRLSMLFHHACNQSRDIPPTGYYEPGVDLSGVFPKHNPLSGITSADVGTQVAAYLKLEDV